MGLNIVVAVGAAVIYRAVTQQQAGRKRKRRDMDHDEDQDDKIIGWMKTLYNAQSSLL